MKKLRIAALLLVFCLCLGAVNARAEEWSEEYYRANDTEGLLSDAEQKSLDEDCISFVSTWHLDLAMLGLTPEYYEGETLREHAAEYYGDCGFGYGDGRDGFVLVYDMETEEAVIVAFGQARDAIPADYLAFVERSVVELRAEHGIFGVMYGAYRHLSNYMEDPSQFSRTPDGAPTEPAVPSGAAVAGMPDWYPADPKSFQFYHDENAPRVVDGADIFSDAEERAMEARITVLRRELQRDIVVYTDVSDYGLGRDICAADFYDFNGYGYGSEREGFCLFICMEEGNRGFWTCGTGSDSRSLQTEEVANALDDVLYDYMVDKRYGEGVASWIENIAGLYRTGFVFAPDWFPDRGESVQRFHSAAAARVVDDAGFFTQDEIGRLSSLAADTAARTGVDVVIYTVQRPVGIWLYQFAETYYSCMGYGVGDGYDGMMLVLYRTSEYGGYSFTYGFGSCEAKLTDVAADRLEEHVEDKLRAGRAFDAASGYLDETEHLLRTGRVPRTFGSWMKTLALGLILGSVFGLIALLYAIGKMRTVQKKSNADRYLVPNSLRVASLRDDYLGTTTSRRYHPRERGSGGSSGGSSYSSSYSGSSGASHSGSGRSF